MKVILISAIFLYSITFAHLASTKSIVTNVAFIKLGAYHGLDENNAEYKKTYYVPRYFRSSWVNTRSICKAYGFEIVSFETIHEANAVVNLCKRQPKLLDYYTYIGGITLTGRSSTNWYWVNSNKKISFEIPSENLDFGGRDEYCLALGPASDYRLVDVHCSGYEFKFICQKLEFSL